MYSASDYRGMARRALKNYWWLAVGVTLLARIELGQRVSRVRLRHAEVRPGNVSSAHGVVPPCLCLYVHSSFFIVSWFPPHYNRFSDCKPLCKFPVDQLQPGALYSGTDALLHFLRGELRL